VASHSALPCCGALSGSVAPPKPMPSPDELSLLPTKREEFGVD